VNALLRRFDQVADPHRYVRQVAQILPNHRFRIVGYAGSSFDEIVEETAEVIGAAPEVVVGISFGGFVAMRLAAQRPDLAKRLVLAVSAYRFSAAGRRMVERQVQALERGDLPRLIRENTLLFRRPWYNALVRLKLWKDRDRLAAGFRAAGEILSDYRRLFGPELDRNAEFCRRIVCPTLIVAGTADQLFDREALEETAALIPGAQLKLFEEETHMLPIEKSQAVAAAIDGFLRRS
jgi:pimeloyl-ACP methyl ester carboxylesterase